MTGALDMAEWALHESELLQWLKGHEGEKFHAMLCDPPYHLTSITERFGKEGSAPAKGGVYSRSAKGFMGQQWDGGDMAFQPSTWAAIKKVLYPGAFGMAFAGSRGWHRMAVAIEDSGMILHPTIFCWTYGSGFPKATRIDRTIDRQAGVEQEVVGYDASRARPNRLYEVQAIGNIGGSGTGKLCDRTDNGATITAPATELAKAWAGHRYGLQAMKPAAEPIIVFQKPYEGKPLENITATGAGALNIDGGRIAGPKGNGVWGTSNATCQEGRMFNGSPDGEEYRSKESPLGRWPANLCLCHTPECKRVGTKQVDSDGHFSGKVQPDGIYKLGLKQIPDRGNEHAEENGKETVDDWICVDGCPVKALNEQSGESKSSGGRIGVKGRTIYNAGWEGEGHYREGDPGYGDIGGASRFFFNADWNLEVEERLFETEPFRYCAKASRGERDAGVDAFPLKTKSDITTQNFENAKTGSGNERNILHHNNHPTVKPISLNRWLASLLLPPEKYAPRRLLVPFAGVGSEMIGAVLAGWDEVVGIEMMPEYVKIGRARLEHWSKGRTAKPAPRKVAPKAPATTPKRLNTLDAYLDEGAQ